jgi:hypothetical protein
MGIIFGRGLNEAELLAIHALNAVNQLGIQNIFYLKNSLVAYSSM